MRNWFQKSRGNMLQNNRSAILLSTYNGLKHLKELINSLENQSKVALTVFIRDDGSTDGTFEYIQELAKNNQQVVLISDNRGNIGAARSFHTLLEYAIQYLDFEYFSFCDQDDVWYPEKVFRAVNAIQSNNDIPILYCSNFAITNENLEIRGFHNKKSSDFHYKNALVENLAIGSTIVLNRRAAEIVTKHNPILDVGHDAWYYLVISFFGQIIYDSKPSMLYRRHSNTETSYSSNAFTYKRIIRFLTSGNKQFLYQSKNLYTSKYYEEMQVEKSVHLHDHQVLVGKEFVPIVRYVMSNSFFRSRKVDTFILKIGILVTSFLKLKFQRSFTSD
jgi:glycosyltransferase involved in cell wall biosynthesis